MEISKRKLYISTFLFIIFGAFSYITDNPSAAIFLICAMLCNALAWSITYPKKSEDKVNPNNYLNVVDIDNLGDGSSAILYLSNGRSVVVATAHLKKLVKGLDTDDY